MLTEDRNGNTDYTWELYELCGWRVKSIHADSHLCCCSFGPMSGASGNFISLLLLLGLKSLLNTT